MAKRLNFAALIWIQQWACQPQCDSSRYATGLIQLRHREGDDRFVLRITAGVAQSVEQRTRNAKVVGSIPISGTSKTTAFSEVVCFH